MKAILTSSLIAAVIATGALFLVSGASKEVSLAGVSPDVYGYFNVHGAFTQGGGVKTVTPTSATVALTGADLRDANVITFTASSTMPALTATLPASSTIPLSAEAGSYRSWVIENPFLGAATTTTIAAGTGIDLQEPDGQNVVIGIDNYAWLTCFREASTDVVCRVDESIPAD